MIIRQENRKDYDEVYKVIKQAFLSAEHSDGTEQDLVVSLRKSISFIPELSLVAVENDKIIGHILFTKIMIGSNVELALAPLSVLPDYQKRGIGSALITEGHRIAKTLGYDYSIVLGSPRVYGKAGYVPASTYGIKPPFAVSDENFMATKLKCDAKALDGTVKYDDAFGIN